MSDQPIELRLLGGVEAYRAGERVDIGHARQRCVLAVLLLSANTSVSVDDLIDRVWGDEGPTRAKESLHSYLTRLRRALPEVSISRRGAGYVASVEPTAVDVHRFRDLVAKAGHSTDTGRSEALFQQAMALWRGEPLAGLDVPWARQVRTALATEHRTAELDHIDVRLRLGQHNDMLPALAALTDTHQLDERLTGQLMLALYRGGRQAEALDRYTRIRTRLAEELGIDPSPALQALYQQILTTEPALDAPEPPPSPCGPRQLPAAPRSFTGRSRELRRLTATLDPAGGPGTTVVISAIGGTGGIGKSWLALHWAYDNVHRFPDGQLFVNLRGFDPSGKPTAPQDALRGFLEGLGVPASAMPAELDALSASYRSLVSGRRMLVVLDNAADPEQVIPLLPGSSSCTVLVTSRDHLVNLIDTHGAQALPLDALTEAECRLLLATRIGADRLAREPDAVDDLLASCAGLPLALSIVAGRALEHPDFPLRALADELRDAERRLEILDEEPTSGVRSVLSWSYSALTEEQARVFGLLSLAPGPDISLPAAAHLTDLTVPRARSVLRTLERVSLVQQHVPDRFRMHDLVRLYATEAAIRHQQAEVRETAVARLVDFYVRAAHDADRVLAPERPVAELYPAAAGLAPFEPSDAVTATDWFAAEHACLLATQQFAARSGEHRVVWLLAWTLNTFHWRAGHAHDDLASCRLGLAAAQQLDEPTTMVLAHRRLGGALTRLGRSTQALEQLEMALALARETGDLAGEGYTHLALVLVWGQFDDDRRALDSATAALRIFESLGDQVWQAEAGNAVGWYLTRLGRHDEARGLCEAALTFHREQGNYFWEHAALDSLGYIAHHCGDYAAAIDYFQQALVGYRELGNTHFSADTYGRLGESYAAIGDQEAARSVWQEALRLFRAQHRSTDVRAVEKQLGELGAQPANDSSTATT
ncbi:MAG TPA: BTAD domain-containing putative transcriptional regulator [Pseudonocardiaceae bacterium]|nr:BTAD domain-containing putative transcriptional regulator [Pseudonocardiaceae bacterium]